MYKFKKMRRQNSDDVEAEPKSVKSEWTFAKSPKVGKKNWNINPDFLDAVHSVGFFSQFKVPINMVGVSLHQGQKTSKLIMLNSVTLLIWQITNMLLLRLAQIVLPTGH